MTTFKIKPLLIALSLSAVSANTWAQLYSPNLNVNSITNDYITATVGFSTPVLGDLYIATELAGTLYFFGPGGSLSTTPTAFQKNTTFSADITILDAPCAGIAPGTYPLYEVVTNPNTNVMEVGNWVGGINGLSKIEFNINLNNTAPVVTTPVTTTPVDTTPTTTTTTSLDGQALYKSKGCSASSCHKTDPKSNANHILSGNSLASLKSAIAKNPSDMGYLTNASDPQFATDAELQAIADYLKSL